MNNRSTMIFVIKYPEMTKKTSTPEKPDVSKGTLKWKRTTIMTAKARNPFMSFLNLSNFILVEPYK
ncbi:hypothetical protein NUBL17186_17500 [Klebsiella quasipneumoniae]|nr:hypothetical protein NUBL17186_17500 [Klebsiella quasipneumoniae]